MQSLDDALRIYQQDRKLRTVADLAKALGVSRPTVYDALEGKRLPNIRTAIKYAKALKITREEVMAMGMRSVFKRPSPRKVKVINDHRVRRADA